MRHSRPPLLTVLQKVVGWTLDRTADIPKSQRFTFGQRLNGAGGWGQRRRQDVLAGWRWEHRGQEMPGRCVERAGAAKAVLGRGL